MAKKSKIARNEQRKVIVARYAEKRLELKKTLVDPNATDEAREAARQRDGARHEHHHDAQDAPPLGLARRHERSGQGDAQGEERRSQETDGAAGGGVEAKEFAGLPVRGQPGQVGP